VTANTRKAARFNVTIKVTISYQHNCQRHPEQQGVLVNISETGLCVKTDSVLPRGAVAFVDLELPDTEEKTRTIGKIVWSKDNGEAGIELGYIPAKQFKFLVPFLQSTPSSGAGASAPPADDAKNK
jgi:hypothetical protein